MFTGQKVLVAALLLFPAAFAQDASDSLNRLEKCGNDAIKPKIQRLRNGLVHFRWVKNEAQKNSKLPDEYLKNLSDLASACEAGTATPEAIVADLDAKIEDCLQYGMGRAVPLQIETLQGSQPVSAWEVRYQWVSGKDPGPAELRVPGVTPAKFMLPPGIYAFHARKNQIATSKINVPVVGKDVVLVQIAVQ